jgi:hypothetical protein
MTAMDTGRIWKPVHGNIACWTARMASSTTPLLLILLAFLKWGWGDWAVGIAVVAGIALVGFRWHLVPAMLLLPGGILLCAWLAMYSAWVSSFPGEWTWLWVTLIAGGMTNLLAWLYERQRQRTKDAVTGLYPTDGRQRLCDNCGCQSARGSKTCEWCGADVK